LVRFARLRDRGQVRFSSYGSLAVVGGNRQARPRRVRLTMRYCEICKRAFCEGDQAHGPIGGLKKAAPMMSAAAGFTISPSQTILHIRRSSLTFVKCSQRRFADAFLRRCLLRER
jgi:hypothetical protein